MLRWAKKQGGVDHGTTEPKSKLLYDFDDSNFKTVHDCENVPSATSPFALMTIKPEKDSSNSP